MQPTPSGTAEEPKRQWSSKSGKTVITQVKWIDEQPAKSTNSHAGALNASAGAVRMEDEKEEMRRQQILGRQSEDLQKQIDALTQKEEERRKNTSLWEKIGRALSPIRAFRQEENDAEDAISKQGAEGRGRPAISDGREPVQGLSDISEIGASGSVHSGECRELQAASGIAGEPLRDVDKGAGAGSEGSARNDEREVRVRWSSERREKRLGICTVSGSCAQKRQGIGPAVGADLQRALYAALLRTGGHLEWSDAGAGV